jgi:hypothetical protein
LSHCPALVPQTVQRCSGTLGCSWQASGWSECSSICGLGESLRDVWCPSGNDADCGQDARPSHNNSCYSTAGCSWSKGPWTACSSSCGSGLHNREVSWPSGKASDCPGQAPVSSEACYSTLGCTWVTQNWSSCDNTCGDGSQTRNVSCSGGPGDGDCALAGLRPSALAACRSTVGCAWNISSWSSCSTEWGPGLQSRDVQCPSGNPLDRGPSGTAPATSQPCCATAACAWSVSAWSQCSNDCGTGEMVRSVACSSGRTADCGGAEPLVKQPCSVTAGCNWNLSAWTACNATCGAGVQSRDASCSSPNPAGCPSPGPAVLQHCYVTSGCAWLVANWDSCGSSCGAGSRQRSVQCPSGSVGDCPGNRPASQEACYITASGTWHASAWGACGVACGQGLRSRTVACPSGVDSDCGNLTWPKLESCYSTNGCSWLIGDWSECSSDCGAGFENRSVTCSSGIAADCQGPTPDASRTCYVTDRCAWQAASWSPCNSTCGHGWQDSEDSGSSSYAPFGPAAQAGIQEPVGFWDLPGLSADNDEETFKCHRAAKTKLGRLAMYATMGYVVPFLCKAPGYVSPSPDLKFEDVPNGRSASSKCRLAIMAIVGKLFHQGPAGSAWGDWATHSASPLRVFDNDLGVQGLGSFWKPTGFTADGNADYFKHRRQTELNLHRTAKGPLQHAKPQCSPSRGEQASGFGLGVVPHWALQASVEGSRRLRSIQLSEGEWRVRRCHI